MRILSTAIAVVFTFGVGVWAISRVIGEAMPSWVGLTASMAWLFLVIFTALRLSGTDRGKRSDQRRLLAYSLFAAALMALFLGTIFTLRVQLPKSVAEAILAVIAGLVFLLARYMEHRKVQRTLG